MYFAVYQTVIRTYILMIIVKKTLQFTTPFKDDIRRLAGLKQQISQKMILLVLHKQK